MFWLQISARFRNTMRARLVSTSTRRKKPERSLIARHTELQCCMARWPISSADCIQHRTQETTLSLSLMLRMWWFAKGSRCFTFVDNTEKSGRSRMAWARAPRASAFGRKEAVAENNAIRNLLRNSDAARQGALRHDLGNHAADRACRPMRI